MGFWLEREYEYNIWVSKWSAPDFDAVLVQHL